MRLWVQSLGKKDLPEEEMATHSSILAGKNPMDKGTWQARVHGVAKSQTQLGTHTLSRKRHESYSCIVRWRKILESLKEISLEYSLAGLMLKLKLQYFGHLMQRADSFEKTLMLGKTEGRRRGW